jgi:ABC-type uncharacterized transport system substrate-binding protein
MKKPFNIFLIAASALLFLFLTLSISWAHPHVAIYNSVVIVFDQKGLAGFRIRWRFDEIFSNMMFLDYDTNKNKRFEPSEIQSIKTKAFSNLGNFDYFTHVKINDTPFKVKYVKDFSAAIQKNSLVYQFFVPCHVQALASNKTVKLAVYDQSFYCNVFLEEDPVSFENKSGYQIDYTIQKNKEEAYYYGQISPDELTLTFRLKK